MHMTNVGVASVINTKANNYDKTTMLEERNKNELIVEYYNIILQVNAIKAKQCDIIRKVEVYTY